MKQTLKFTLTILLAMFFVCAAVTLGSFTGPEIGIHASALDTSGSCGTDVTYTFDSATGTLTISGTGQIYTYTSTSSPFYNQTAIQSVVIEDGVTGIGSYTFSGCTGLTDVTIGNGVTRIGDYAFSGCTGLTSITIPDRVTRIGSYSFQNCSGLTDVTIGSGVTSISDHAFYNCTGLADLAFPNRVTSIGSYAFYRCTNLTDLTIPDSVTTIGSYAFDNCTGLTSVAIGSGVRSINSYTFYNCAGLTSMTIGSSVTSIGTSAFYRCIGLTSITIPDSVTSIGSEAFRNCTGLQSLTMPCSAKIFNDSATFGSCTNLTHITLTRGSGVMQNYGTSSSLSAADTYYQYTPWYISRNSIQSITLEDGITSIGSYAFRECTGLTSITIPDSITSIGNHAFYNCTGLTGATIGDSVTSIGNWAFYNCTGLTDVTIPDSVMTIGNYAFRDCTGLTDATIGSSVTSIREGAFYNCTGLTDVTIPDSVMTIGSYAFRGCTGLTDATIGSSVTSIGSYAFFGCTGLTDITIPGSVTSIGNSAFQNCSRITSIIIPDSVTSIGSYAFSNCSGLASVIVSNGNTVYDSRENCNAIIETQTNTLISGCKNTVIPGSVTSIGSNAFYYCATLTSITIPDCVTTIGGYAFSGCTGLTSITIPDSVTSIGVKAFHNCTALTDMTILSRDCVIGNDSVPAAVTIYGYTGSTAEEYASSNGNPFVCLDAQPADYTAVTAALNAVPRILVYYTDTSVSALRTAIGNVEYGLDADRQADVDAMAAAIRTAAAGLELATYTVTVPSGCTAAQTFDAARSEYYRIATVSAPRTSGGQTFTYWADENGTPVSTYLNYSFFVTRDTALRPVYGEDKSAVLHASRVTDVRDNGDGTHSVFAEHSVSSSASIIAHGVICTTEQGIGTDEAAMTLENDSTEKYAARLTANALTGLLEIPLTLESGTLYCRAYTIDADNNVHYGPLQQFAVGSAGSDSAGEIILTDSVTEIELAQAEPPAEEEPQPDPAPQTLLEIAAAFIQKILLILRAIFRVI